MSSHSNSALKQRGSMLLEALISILIFSIGILAIVGLQATSIKMSSDAKYRSDASLLANQLIGQMWADIASSVATTSTACSAPFTAAELNSFLSPSGGDYVQWLPNVQAALPNANVIVSFDTPTTITPAGCVSGTQQNTTTTVTIQINWQQPGDSNPHNFTTSATISAQKQT